MPFYYKSILDDATFAVEVYTDAQGGLDADGEPVTPSAPTVVEGCTMNISEGYPPADWTPNDRRLLPVGRATLYAPYGTQQHFKTGSRVVIPPEGFMPGNWRVLGPPMNWDEFGITVFMEYLDQGA